MRNVSDARPNGSANRFFRRGSRSGLICETSREELHQQTGDCEHNCGDNKEICRPDRRDKIFSDVRAQDRTERPPHRNETIKSLTLLDRKQIGYERPEDGGVEEIEHTDPNEQSATDPNLLLRRAASHQYKEKSQS